jgi:hypothetical protein
MFRGNKPDFPFVDHVYSLWMPGVETLELTEDEIKKQPKRSGIYFRLQSIGIIYIGKSEVGFKRPHFHHRMGGTMFLWVDLPPGLLNAWETAAIQYFRPQVNIKAKPLGGRNDHVLGIPGWLESRGYFDLEAPRVIRVLFFPPALDAEWMPDFDFRLKHPEYWTPKP